MSRFPSDTPRSDPSGMPAFFVGLCRAATEELLAFCQKRVRSSLLSAYGWNVVSFPSGTDGRGRNSPSGLRPYGRGQKTNSAEPLADRDIVVD